MNNRTFKFVFSKLCMDKLEEFTKTHISEERIQFKKSWLKWTIDDINQAMILNESSMLIAKGCQENIINKMFICVRFYLKKKKLPRVDPVALSIPSSAPGHPSGEKSLSDKESNVEIKKKIDVQIKTKHVSDHIIFLVNNHINENISLFISPAELYNDFSTKYDKELKNLLRDVIKDKKTYKNRYYIIKSQMKSSL